MIRSLSLRPSWLFAPWADQTREAQCPPGHPGLLRPGFQVAGSPRAPAGYHYEAKLRIASAGLSPASTAASLAALHHITPDALHRAFHALKRDAAAGVDGITWDMYGEGLDERLLDLHRRLHNGGAYRAPPVRPAEIPKPDGGTRPLGIAALEDKIVQKAVVDVILTPIYEVELLGFSYGFRPGRGAHDALDALAFEIERRKVSWIADADPRAYFDTIPRDWLITFLEHRIGDRRVIRLIQKWLREYVPARRRKNVPRARW